MRQREKIQIIKRRSKRRGASTEKKEKVGLERRFLTVKNLFGYTIKKTQPKGETDATSKNDNTNRNS